MKRLALLALVALAPTALAQPLPIPRPAPPLSNSLPLQTYAYTARTATPVRRIGAVTAGGITWHCSALQCTVSGPWPAPGVFSCQALAREVGAITYYGHPAAQLNATQLVQCNAPPSAAASVSIATAEISVVGGTAATGPPDMLPVARTTDEVSIVGGAAASGSSDIPPVAVTTPEVSVVGG